MTDKEMNALELLKDEVKIMVRTVNHLSGLPLAIIVRSKKLKCALRDFGEAEKEADGQ